MTSHVLLTSMGSGVCTAVLDCLDGRRDEFRIIGMGCNPDTDDRARCDAFILVPPTDDPSWSDAVAQIVHETWPLGIIPGRCDDVVALAQLAAQDDLTSQALLAGAMPLAADLRDTARAAEFGQRLGLPFARTVPTGMADSPIQAAQLTAAYPDGWIVKPSSGSGSRGAWVTRRRDLVLSAVDVPAHVIQPMLGKPPPELSHVDPLPVVDASSMLDTDVQVILGPDSSVLAMGAFATTMRGGRVSEVNPHHDPATVDLAQAYADALSARGWRGPVNIQAAQDAEGAWLAFEINPRFGGGSRARTRWGFDEVNWCLEAWRSSGCST